MGVRDHFGPGSGERWEARMRARQWLADAAGVAEGVDLVELARRACPESQGRYLLETTRGRRVWRWHTWLPRRTRSRRVRTVRLPGGTL